MNRCARSCTSRKKESDREWREVRYFPPIKLPRPFPPPDFVYSSLKSNQPGKEKSDEHVQYLRGSD
ncbi:hypothetical protein PANT111_190164 [Pantoea brenneri]|uniref:Uncharacterized protein n=1 Tax=Pantoea brenneri TaxID=472694 RepID=A0AAX3J6T7_9GAMM|nr:hypothetical protein PANT111_190164 [Pantoea brenneri]